jgi:two-component system NtrC family sensor kinase
MQDHQMRTDDGRQGSGASRGPSTWGWFAALGVVVVLLLLGTANVAVRATWHALEDGVLWASGPQGVSASEVSEGSTAARAGVHVGDVLLAIDGRQIERPADVAALARLAGPNDQLTYTLLRLGTRELVQVQLAPVPQGNGVLYFVLAGVGIFTLLVGAMVRLRRPGDASSLHFFWLSVAFFGIFTFSFSGRFDTLDWVFYWADALAVLVFPPLLLHFTLVFPERSGAWARTAVGSRLIPVLYLPALLMAASRVMAVARLDGSPNLLAIVKVLDRVEPAYLACGVGAGFAVMLGALRHVRSVTARRQLRWIVWGTLLGGAPFALGYALPFAFGASPSVRMELLAIPLGLIPLAFASAIIRYRLMDVEVIIKRSLVYVAAMSAVATVYALLLRLVGWVFPLQPPRYHTVVAALAATVIVLLARPVKDMIQSALDRVFYRDRYDYRRALVGFARDLSTDLDVARLAERLVARVTETLVVDRMAVMLRADDTGDYRALRSSGFAAAPPRLNSLSGIGLRLAAGQVVALDDPLIVRRFAADEVDFWRDRGVHYFIPCVSKQTTIAALAIGRKDRAEPLSSEDMSLLVAVAAQVGTALENGRLYQQLRAQADEVERMRQFNENILESLDEGLAVVDADDRIMRWNRSLEALCGLTREEVLGKRLDETLPPSVMDVLRAARHESADGAELYRVPLTMAHNRSDRGLLVNIAVAPLQGQFADLTTGGWILAFEDVTARAHLEEQLQIADKMASIGLLAAGVAHEVNTPLTGISSYTQMLLERADPDSPDSKLLEKIERQTFRAAKIVNGLLTLARGGHAEQERGPVDLNGVVNDVLALLEHQLKAVSIQVRRDLCPTAPIVHGVEHKLQQVFLNLFINARDAMPKGGWLSITTRVGDGEAMVQVADTGAGIPAEHLSRIYDPFFTTKSLGQGTGLGLSITYGIVREHDGSMTCDSRVGEGTRFTLTLPMAPVVLRASAGGGAADGR